MIKYISGLFLLLFSFSINGQNIVKVTASKGNDFGVAYSLPKTRIKISGKATKTTHKAGEFYQYAERYLNVNNPILKDEVRYKLEEINVQTFGVADKDHSYLVQFKPTSLAPFVSLTEDGLLCAINSEEVPSVISKGIETTIVESNPPYPPNYPPNPKSYFTEEILRAGSTSKQAELIAKQIYSLRETRNAILTGEADNIPPDGAAYKVVMDQLNEQEKSLTSLFLGTTEIEENSSHFETVITPDSNNINRRVISRFSSKLGFVEADDLAGEPIYLSLINKEPKAEVVLTDKEQKAMEKKFSAGIIYNIPAKADLKVEFLGKSFVDIAVSVVQYGKQEVLSPVELEFKKGQTQKIHFFPQLGAIREIVNQ